MVQPEFDTTPSLEHQVLDKLGIRHLKDSPTKTEGVTLGCFLDAYPPDSPHKADTVQQLEYFLPLEKEHEHYPLFEKAIKARILGSLKDPEG